MKPTRQKKNTVNRHGMYTDVRVIDMNRQPQTINPAFLKDGDDWLSLGHFSQFKIIKIESKSSSDEMSVDLSHIYEHNQDLSRKADNSYNQPIYLLQEFPLRSKKKVDSFWGKKSAFLLATRVHAALAGQQEFEGKIKESLNTTIDGDETHPVSFDCTSVEKSTLGKEVEYIYYRTLEFSDVILVAKSDSLESLMKVIGRLYGHPSVGDSYSFIGIAPSEFSIENSHYAQREDLIPYALMRFAVKDARAARRYLEAFEGKISIDLKEKILPPLLVTGTEDLKILVHNVSSKALCQILYNILPSINLPAYDDSISFWSAFYDMTTRLSIDESSLYHMSGVSIPASYELHRAYTKLYSRVQRLYSIVGNRLPDWLRPTAELTKLMQSLSGDCIFYQVCYTVLDGARGLVRLAEKSILLDQTDPANKATIDMLQMTLSGISDLMEHMIRMEGELVHHPESRPILYDIPANLLELYLHFSESCMAYFRNREYPAAIQRCRLIIVPCLCSTIKVKNITNYVDEEPALIYVEIPLHLLYDSKYAICSLIHEVSHFSGEITRNRATRFKFFAFGVACQVAAHIEMYDSKEVIKELAQKIMETIPDEMRSYMDQLQCGALDAVDALCEDEQFIDDLTFMYFSNLGSVQDWDTKYIKATKTKMNMKRRSSIHQDIKELVYLYREAYADLSMVSLLQLPIEDYLNMVKQDVRIEDASILPLAIERAAVVIHTVNDGWANNANCTNSFDKTVQEYLVWMINHKDNRPFRIPGHSFEAVGAIIKYLKECHKAMRTWDQKRENAEDLSRIRTEFVDFADNQKFASAEFYMALELHRQRLIQSNCL